MNLVLSRTLPTAWCPHLSSSPSQPPEVNVTLNFEHNYCLAFKTLFYHIDMYFQTKYSIVFELYKNSIVLSLVLRDALFTQHCFFRKSREECGFRGGQNWAGIQILNTPAV